ncbi:MAG: hypothetical protein WDO17_28340 [Alphaproteobacteria bacterium]
MSYLNNVRLIFSGTFQADISTVNNDVRHFDNATFEQRFQSLQSTANRHGPLNGWFNPTGSGAFRLIDCRVSSVCYKDGTSQSDPAKDPVVGMLIGGSNTRVSGKLVDLDPQWQMASQIWGLEVKLTDAKGVAAFGGKFRPSAFRDILFTRVGGPAGDGGASAYFQSVIECVSFADDAPNSTFLTDLRGATTDKLLSIRLMTFGYVGDWTSPNYTLGTVLGVIGPCGSVDEPTSFVSGRRFTPKPGPLSSQQPASSFQGINYFTAVVDEDAKMLLLDLGNALPLASTDGTIMKLGTLSAGLLLDGSLTEQSPVTPQSFQSVGTIPYDKKGWLAATSGIVALPLTPAQIAQSRNTPLALVTQPANGGGPVVAMRETQDGILVCAEPSVLRIDSPDSQKTRIFAAKFGKPITIAVNTAQVGPQDGAGGTGDPHEIDPPAAAIPTMGTPETMLDIPQSVTTGPNGYIDLTVNANVTGTPRDYMDGQVYLIQYGASGQPATAFNQVDFIAVHARSAFTAPAKPAWDDVKDILTQFGNLYPIMSQKLFNIADPAEVKRNVHLLRLAFGLDIGDPNYMPVTRDLSASKQQMIVTWLDNLAKEEAAIPAQEVRQQPAAPVALHATAAAPRPAPPTVAAAPVGGKTQFARTLRIKRKSF